MGFKDKLVNFYKEIVEEITYNEEDDFNADFEDHEVGNQKYYRLHYINYHNINRDSNCRGVIDWPYKPFELPNGMSREDCFKVLSYLTDFIEQRDDVDEASWKSVGTLDGVISLEKFGFKRLDFTPEEDEIIDLFTIDGRIKRFKDSKYYSMYFNWYIPNISKNEIKKIYQKCGFVFSDIAWLDNLTKNNEKENVKQLKLERK